MKSAREYLEAGQSPQNSKEIRITKTPEIIDRLYRTYDFSRNPDALILSPSALNTYLDCRLKFYFRYVARLKAPMKSVLKLTPPCSEPSSTVLPNWFI